MLVDTINKVKNVSIGYVGSDGLFDSATVNAYTASLRGLSETQAKVVLSSTTLDKAQQKQILNKLTETNATVTLTSAEASEALTRKLGSQQAAEKLLIKAGLISADELQTGVTIALKKEMVEKAIALGKITEEEGKQILTTFGLTGGNVGLSTSFKLLGKTIKTATVEMLKWLATNPFGWATIAIGAVAGLVKGYDALISRQEKLARTKIEGLNEDISEYDAEINSLTELQNKLESAKGDKTELAKIQTELNEAIGDTPGLLNGEGKAWDAANVKIQANIDLLKQQRKEAQQNKVNASKELFDNNTYEVDWNFDITGDQMKYVMANYQKYLNAYKEMDEESIEWAKKVYGDFENAEEYAIKRLNYGGIQISDTTKLYTSISQSELESYWKEQIDVAYDVFEDTINSYDGAGGQNFLKNLISNMVKGGSDLSDISTAVTQVIENEDMQNAINDYWESLVDPNIDSEKALSKVKSIFDGIVAQFPELAGFFDNFYNQIATGGSNAAKSVETSANKMTVSCEALDKSLSSVVQSETDLKTISDVVNGKLYLTNEEMSALTKKYPDLANKIKLTTKGWTLESSAMDIVEDSVLDLQTSYVSAQNAISEALSSQMAQRIGNLNSELLAVQTVAEAYAILAQSLTDDLGMHFTKSELRTRGFSKEKQEIIDFVTGLGKAREASAKALEKLKELQNSGLGKNPSGGSSKNDPKYSDPTDAIINRINAEANQLAKQGEIIESNLDLIDSEKDYAKAIDETNNLISNRTSQINALKLANSKLHNEADKARNSNSYTNEESWFDADGDETEAFYELMNSLKTDEAQEKLQNEFNKIQKFKKAYLENEKLIQDLTKENIKSIEDISDIASKALENHFDERNEISERWIQTQTDFDQLAIDGQIEAYARMVRNNREFLKEIEKNEHLSAEERDRLWKETSDKIVDYQLEAYSLVKKAIQQYSEEVEKGYDIRISRLNSESSLLSTHFDLINAISEEQHNLNKELAEAEVAGAKMNKIERQTLFTKEEHAKLTDKLNGLLGDVVAIQSNYLSELETATKETIEEITNNYERQYELKMKEYEVVKAELALVKAEQKLKNVENEKSVRTWDGTKWVYEADFQDVVDAKLAVEDAKYAVWQAQTSQAQQTALNAIDSTADSLETQKSLFAETLEELSGETKITGQQLTEALKYIAEVDLPTFEKIIEQFGDSLSEAFDVDVDSVRGSAGGSSSSGMPLNSSHLNYSRTVVQMKANSAAYASATPSEQAALHSQNASLAAGIGATFNGGTGHWEINGSKLYANGSKSTQKGLGIFDENGIGSEYVLTKDGILHNFNMGDKVFNPKMGDNLYEAAQIDWKKVSLADFGGLASIDNSIRNMSSDTYYNVNGVNINSEEGGEIKGFVKFLKAKKI